MNPPYPSGNEILLPERARRAAYLERRCADAEVSTYGILRDESDDGEVLVTYLLPDALLKPVLADLRVHHPELNYAKFKFEPGTVKSMRLDVGGAIHMHEPIVDLGKVQGIPIDVIAGLLPIVLPRFERGIRKMRGRGKTRFVKYHGWPGITVFYYADAQRLLALLGKNDKPAAAAYRRWSNKLNATDEKGLPRICLACGHEWQAFGPMRGQRCPKCGGDRLGVRGSP